jgi:hypothetical protein
LSNAEPKPDSSWRGCFGCLSALCLVAGVLGLLVYFTFHPRNRVRVHFTNVPQDIGFLSVIAETDGTLSNMNWSPEMLVPLDMDPRECIWSYRWPGQSNRDSTSYFVWWKQGRRYGIVTLNTEKKGSVTWFEPADVPFKGRSFLLGGGEVEFDLAKGRTEDFPRSKAKALGLTHSE